MSSPAPAKDMPRNLAGRQLGRYEVLTQLASGGMAAVYVARAKGVAGFERLVAIKVLHPHLAYEEEFISMFLDEARLAARIRHPNVVPTLDISDTDGDGFFLVMEYIEGDHLGTLLSAAARAGERLPTPVVVRILLDSLGGLGAAHALLDDNGEPMHLVHRDISPHNIMVGVDGISRLTDFGVAKAEKRLTSTRAGQFKGKLAYMAPEQASTGFADQRSDLFSMGILTWESLTGRRLFRGENNAATLTKILQSDIPAPSALWPELAPFDEVCLRALDRDAEQRFQNADEFASALEEAAMAAGGVATTRQVRAQVKERLVDKLKEQRERVQESIMQLGYSGIGQAALPIPRDGSGSARFTQPQQPSASTPPSSPASLPPGPETVLAVAPEGNGGKFIAMGAVLLLFVGVGFGGWRFLMAPQDPATPAVQQVDSAAMAGEAAPSEAPVETEPVQAGNAADEGSAQEPEANQVEANEAGANEAEGTDDGNAAEEPTVPEEPEAQRASEGDSEGSTRRRRRDRNRRDRQRDNAAAEMDPEPQAMRPDPAPEPTPSPMEATMTSMSTMRGSSAADDLVNNPYR